MAAGNASGQHYIAGSSLNKMNGHYHIMLLMLLSNAFNRQHHIASCMLQITPKQGHPRCTTTQFGWHNACKYTPVGYM